jgi:hypothetical protein
VPPAPQAPKSAVTLPVVPKSVREAKEERAAYLQRIREAFALTKAKLSANATKLAVRIATKRESRLAYRSQFLRDRCGLSEECRVGLQELIQNYLEAEKKGLREDDIVYQTRELDDTVRTGRSSNHRMLIWI